VRQKKCNRATEEPATCSDDGRIGRTEPGERAAMRAPDANGNDGRTGRTKPGGRAAMWAPDTRSDDGRTGRAGRTGNGAGPEERGPHVAGTLL